MGGLGPANSRAGKGRERHAYSTGLESGGEVEQAGGMTTRLTGSGRCRAGPYKEITWERERELVKYLGEAARWWALERLGWRGQAPRSGLQVQAGGRAGGRLCVDNEKTNRISPASQ